MRLEEYRATRTNGLRIEQHDLAAIETQCVEAN
jgi:hypothetical protein